MTCVWKGLIEGLMCYNLIISRIKPFNFATNIKERNTKTTNVLINGVHLNEKELDENYVAIENLKLNNIGNGYMCSSSDPLLALVCQLYKINIVHIFNHIEINYIYDANDNNCPKIIAESDMGHFWIDVEGTQRLANRALKQIKKKKHKQHKILKN